MLILGTWAVVGVSAHALLVRSVPAANAILEQPPVQVELYFSEPLEPTLSSIRVVDSNNITVDAGDVRVDSVEPTRMTVTLHSLSDGVYTVSWQALSTIDGHQSIGTFPFAVGDAGTTEIQSIPRGSSARLPFSALLSKFLFLVSLTVLLGHRLFVWLIWNPMQRPDPGAASTAIHDPDVWVRIYKSGLIVMLLSIGLGMLSQAGQTSGRELALPWAPETGRILAETRLGVIWLGRLVLAMLAVWLAQGKTSPPKDWLAFVVNLVLLFTVTLTSHAATEVRPVLPMLGDWLHLLGMTFWLGGLVYLFTAIRHLGKLDGVERTKLTSFLTARFSVNAILFVGLIGVTGIYSADLRVGSWPALFTSLYGHVLLVKQIFVAGLLIIAAANLLVISPRLNRLRLQGDVDTTVASRFGMNLILELTFAAFLLASVSFLTYLPPARVVAINPGLTGREEVDDLQLDLSISPGRVGQNIFTLNAITVEGHPLHSAKKVLLRFTPAQGNIAPSELELVGLGDGSFVARGVNLSLPGVWQVQAVVRRDDKFDAYANFDFTLGDPGAASAGKTAIPRQAAWLLMLIGLLCSSLTSLIKAPAGLRLGLGIPLALLTFGLGLLYLTRPVVIETARVNPIAPNSESIAAGQALFSGTCAACHGAEGKGDGPVGLTLNPRPADLRQHAIPGIHTDAQLFEWITNGFPGSRMPAFRNTLSDTDRWNLVNFIRTLAPK